MACRVMVLNAAHVVFFGEMDLSRLATHSGTSKWMVGR